MLTGSLVNRCPISVPKRVGPPPIRPRVVRNAQEGRASAALSGATMPKPSVALCSPTWSVRSGSVVGALYVDEQGDGERGADEPCGGDHRGGGGQPGGEQEQPDGQGGDDGGGDLPVVADDEVV